MMDTAAELQSKTHVKRPLFTNIWIGIRAWVQRDGVAIVVYAITTLLMSYPLAFKLGGDWLAFRDIDTYMKLWDNWWLQNHAFNEPSLNFTNLQFHPIGLDLSFHSISWTVALLTWALARFTDAITAYNLTILFALFTTAYAAYLLVRPFVRYGAAAWLAGAIYSYAPYHVAHSGGHPDLVHLAPIPLAVLLLITAMTKPSVLAAIGAALMVGLAGFTSLYIMVFTLLTIGPILVFLLFDQRRWSRAEIWRVVIVFGVACALLLSVRLVPIFRNSDALSEVIESKYTANQYQTDLISYVLPSRLNPFFAPYTEEIASRFGPMSKKWPAYLGIVPLALTIAALTWKRRRKTVLIWFLIGAMFVILSLGPVLRFNGNLYDNIVLPAQYVSWLPPIRAVGRPDFFVLGVILPIAVLAAFGFDRVLMLLEKNRSVQMALMVAVPGLLLFEYWSGEFPGVSSDVNPFYEQLSQEPDDFAIIQLPMGREKSKRYQFLQTIHQKPIVEGLSGRTLRDAYQYIRSNPILLNWHRDEPLNCDVLTWHRFMVALDELKDDGFRYVVVHHNKSIFPVRFADYFPLEPFYQDNTLTVFRLTDLRYQPPCQTTYEQVFDLPSPEVSTAVVWDQKIGLLGYDLPSIDLNDEMLPITVYWQAQTEMEDSYIAYFHLIDPETDTLVAQTDVIPRGWSYPTSWWIEGEVVEDTVQIPMEHLPSGRYELRIGWYDEKIGTRLTPDSTRGQTFPDGSFLLNVIEY